jgi:hypothetical protein
MTEAQWLECTDPLTMLNYLRNTASERKLRLFACACCRKLWHLLRSVRSRRAVELSERYADGMAERKAMTLAGGAACSAAREAAGRTTPATWNAIAAAPWAARQAAISEAWFAAVGAFGYARRASEEMQHPLGIVLLRDLFGNPFRATRVEQTWRERKSTTVVKLAQTIYDEPCFNHLPILADALEDAGCDDDAILAHCRQPGEHVRGCWVVDLLLGKE